MAIFVLVVLGLCFGSFINALVWRLHEQQKTKSKKKRDALSIAHGRSMCPNCGHTLAAKDLLPVVSWLSLWGKCRYCQAPISRQYPIVELLTAALFVASYIYWPGDNPGITQSIQLGLWLVVLVGLIALAVYDLRWYLLPNRLVFPLQALALFFALSRFVIGMDGYTIVQLIGSLIISSGLFWTLYTVSKGELIGYGDVKLGVVLGLVLGRVDLAFLMLFCASLLGSLAALPLLLTGKAKRTTHIPFGPFLISGTIFVFLFGARLVEYYTSNLLLL